MLMAGVPLTFVNRGQPLGADSTRIHESAISRCASSDVPEDSRLNLVRGPEQGVDESEKRKCAMDQALSQPSRRVAPSRIERLKHGYFEVNRGAHAAGVRRTEQALSPLPTPRLVTFLQEPGAGTEWQLIASAIFNTPSSLPAGVTCKNPT